MGEESKRIGFGYGNGTNRSRNGGGGGDGDGGGGGGDRVTGWEEGLPRIEDLIPLSQALIPVELMSAFSITPEPYRTSVEVHQATQDTLSSIRGNFSTAFSSCNTAFHNDDETNVELDGYSESRKVKRMISCSNPDDQNDTDSVMDDHSNRTSSKRPRLVWTPQLHKRFVDVVAHLGIANAVPKTIMQMMNVEGLTRENVASHLQKYRLYLKRMQGLSNDEGPSSSDPLFASTPVPQNLHESTTPGGSGHGHGHGQMQMPIPLPYPTQTMMMPMPGLGQGGHMRMPYGNPSMGGFHGFESHPYSMMQQRDWSGNSSFGSYPPVAPNGN